MEYGWFKTFKKVMIKIYVAKDLNLPLANSLLKIDVQAAEIYIIKGYKGRRSKHLAVEME